MLCPELFKFPIPTYNVDCIKWAPITKCTKFKEEIKSLQLVRTLSVVIPANEGPVVETIANDLESGSCSLYLVKQLPLAELVRREFLEAFVKRGQLHGISPKTRLETDDCAAIFPDGTLRLSLNRETYHCVKSCSTIKSRRRDKYVVEIDLKSPGAKDQLEKETLAFDMILRWIPPEVPSNLGGNSGMAVSVKSLERYFSDLRSMQIVNLPPAGSKLVKLDEMAIPLLEKPDKPKSKTAVSDKQVFFTPDELMEYIGLLVLDCETVPSECMRPFTPDKCTKQVESVWLLNQQGLFTIKEIQQAIDQLVEFVEEQKQTSPGQHAIPWVALHVQGFPNLPLTVAGSRECGIGYDHDSAYTIVIGGEDDVLWRKMFGCSGKGPIEPGSSI